MPDQVNGSVNYSVKELIARLEVKLDTVLAQISGKAEKSEVLSLESRIANIERLGSPHIAEVKRKQERQDERLAALEKTNNAQAAVRASYKWIVTLAASNILGMGTLLLKIFHVI